MARSVILVEGRSDEAALEAVARLCRFDLSRTDISVMGGATNVRRFLSDALASGLRVTGMCDAGEERALRRALRRVGVGDPGSREELEALGFFVCADDLEDELIRALGSAGVLEVIEANGDGGRFATLQHQPQWRGQPVEQQLRRWMGSQSGRKVAYPPMLVESMEPDQVPAPLRRVLAHATHQIEN